MIRNLPANKKYPSISLEKLSNQTPPTQIFEAYRNNKAVNTLRRQDADLNLFTSYVIKKGILSLETLSLRPFVWENVTWQLVAGFQRWQVASGYAISSINVRLSTLKTYARLATKAGVMDVGEFALINAIRGFNPQEGEKINDARGFHGEGTRLGAKKAVPIALSYEQAQSLKQWSDMPRGRRDTLLMCLLIDQGLRCGEVVGLKVENFSLRDGLFNFRRKNLREEQTIQMTWDTQAAATAYLIDDADDYGSLFKGSLKDGELGGTFSSRAVSKRVRYLGNKIGIKTLSPNDCRFYWITQQIQTGMPIEQLRIEGGWSGLAMPERYIRAVSGDPLRK
ncbi:MAG: site-specific integrase [Chloroflexi bacterium]|nr:site-specific integrase [Chloroflexota bacterium]